MTRYFILLLLTGIHVVLEAQSSNYVPMTVHLPAIQSKNDLYFQLGMAVGPYGAGFEAQGAYSPLRHVLLGGSYFSATGTGTGFSSASGTQVKQWEVAAGVYTVDDHTNGLKTETKTLFGSVMTGFSKGDIRNTYSIKGVSELKYERVFIQPGVFINEHDVLLGIALRLNYLRYTYGDISLDIEPEALTAFRNLEDTGSMVLSELLLQMGFRFGPVDLLGKLTLVNNDTKGLQFARFSIHAGAAANLTRLFSKKDE
jgi:hypothetical protein